MKESTAWALVATFVFIIIITAVSLAYYENFKRIDNNYCEKALKGTAHGIWVKCDMIKGGK